MTGPQHWTTLSLNDTPGKLPDDRVPKDVDVKPIPAIAVAMLEKLDEKKLCNDAMWTDRFTISPQHGTIHGSKAINEAWQNSVVETSGFQAHFAMVMRMTADSSWVNVPFTFKMKKPNGLEGVCSGLVSLVPDESCPSEWKIWCITTVLQRFEGHGDPNDPSQPAPSTAQASDDEQNYTVVIIGAGQNGLSMAGRLRALGIPYVLIERQKDVGYAWWGRYESLHLHTPKEMNNLPFDRTWKSDDPYYLPGLKAAEGYKNYVEKYDINVWTSANIESSTWDESSKVWRLKVRKEDGKLYQLNTKHFILAVGAAHSKPNVPAWPGKFEGTLISQWEYRNSKQWKGKRGVVVGAGTSGHDVAQDMFDAGLSSVTMIQRGKMNVTPVEWTSEAFGQLYNEHVPTEMADMALFTGPAKVGHLISMKAHAALREQNAEFFTGLERAGFDVDRESGIMDLLLSRYGGLYIDIGTSKHIINGDIKIKRGKVVAYTSNGLRFEDGSEIEADVIVLKIGYDHDFRNQIEPLVGKEITSKLGQFLGTDANGDLHGFGKPQYPGTLWMMGGAAANARIESVSIALQIQERELTETA